MNSLSRRGQKRVGAPPASTGTMGWVISLPATVYGRLGCYREVRPQTCGGQNGLAGSNVREGARLWRAAVLLLFSFPFRRQKGGRSQLILSARNRRLSRHPLAWRHLAAAEKTTRLRRTRTGVQGAEPPDGGR